PYPRERKVPVDQTIEVSLSERPAAMSVTPSTIRVFNVATSHEVAGSVTQPSARHLSWAPLRGSLRKAATYRFVVSGLQDNLGNVGVRYPSRFHTIEPPKRHHHKHRHRHNHS
ncbi:MAG: Ig-like domain-containing protein, partial [Actinomycetota bacterium]|nr:Ig-like domain-containing protein [Actinomycetota bacterium]